MKIIELTEERRKDLIDYCIAHRGELDDSLLYDEDLEKFQADESNPTYIAINDEDKIVAAASIPIDENSIRAKKSRFRIFHSEISEIEVYDSLLQNILKHTKGLDKINSFVLMKNEELMRRMVDLHFLVERYIYLMERDADPVAEIKFPEDYTIRPLKRNQDEEIWCQVRNAAFVTVKGSETPYTPAQVKNMLQGNDYIEGGCMLLYHKNRAIGCIRCSLDEQGDEPIVCIGPLAVIPEYQAKGLGRMLLRTAINFARNIENGRTYLCVNADNERAKSLYLQEGFQQVEAVVCYYYKCTAEAPVAGDT